MYGEISSVKIPVGKQCGFVQFAQRYEPIQQFQFPTHILLCKLLLLQLRHLINCWSYSIARKNAEEALQGLNGSTIGKQTVRLSWGRNPANKQVRACSALHSSSRQTVK
jgi:hypothetical protein